METLATTKSDLAPKLRRALGLWDLILYGIVVIQPTAPMPVFGVVSEKARGHVVTAVLLAMLAMLVTAISYGRMARAYPSAGSAFTYVGREIHPALGYVTGWGMVEPVYGGTIIDIPFGLKLEAQDDGFVASVPLDQKENLQMHPTVKFKVNFGGESIVCKATRNACPRVFHKTQFGL